MALKCLVACEGLPMIGIQYRPKQQELHIGSRLSAFTFVSDLLTEFDLDKACLSYPQKNKFRYIITDAKPEVFTALRRYLNDHGNGILLTDTTALGRVMI